MSKQSKPLEVERTVVTVDLEAVNMMLNHHAAAIHAQRVGSTLDEACMVSLVLDGCKVSAECMKVLYTGYGADPELAILRYRQDKKAYYYLLGEDVLDAAGVHSSAGKDATTANPNPKVNHEKTMTTEVFCVIGDASMYLVITPFGFKQTQEG